MVSAKDREILRELGARKAEIGQLPVQKTRREMWTQLNRRERVKPMVWLNEVCWNEMDVDGELIPHTSGPFCRGLEVQIRRELYQWDYMQADMIVEPVVDCPVVIHDTGFGISIDEDIIRIDETDSVVSHRYHAQISGEEDIEKIQTPEVTLDRQATEENYQAMEFIFDGVLPVRKIGRPGFWFAPWDDLVRWTGVQEVLLDLAVRPAYVHAAVDRLVSAHLIRLDQYERMGLLSLNNTNVRVGSGGYGCTDEVPQPDFAPERIEPQDLWGCATAQIFSDVSPDMHTEFALQYEIRWMERFGLNYYGCCEPLHGKLGVLKRVPRLRKISISPRADIRKARENSADDYVMSIKPNPAILAEDRWRPEGARAELQERLDAARGCSVEIILKDISTVRLQPRRLWEWAGIASEVTEEFA